MHVLTINTGSSSVRLAAFAPDGAELRAIGAERHDLGVSAPSELLSAFVKRHLPAPPRLVAHRVVHGGARLTTTRRIDAAVEAEIGRLAPLAPLHNPVALAWVRACREVLGADVPQIAVFDTAFYAHLPEVAATYALPHELSARHEVRRYGFHGLAHQALWSRWRALRPDIADSGRVISFQLGAGCSVTAIDRGWPLDTSMGFSPLEGLMMATRCGDLDAGLVTFLQRAENLSAADMERLLNENSGLRGVSGISGDMRALLAADNPRAPGGAAILLSCAQISRRVSGGARRRGRHSVRRRCRRECRRRARRDTRRHGLDRYPHRQRRKQRRLRPRRPHQQNGQPHRGVGDTGRRIPHSRPGGTQRPELIIKARPYNQGEIP